MPYVKNKFYCDIPFSSETRKDDFYIYSSVKDLVMKCEEFKDKIIRCRTIGILESIHGKFLLSEMDLPMNNSEAQKIQISMVYLKTPPQSTVIPYSVQIFGTLQWINRPVIFAKILQMMTTTMALRVRESMDGVVSMHLAKSENNEDETELCIDSDNNVYYM